MIIDCHNHPDWHGHNLARFLENMDRHGISQTWLLSWEAPADEYDPHYSYCTPDTGVNGPISFSRCVAYAEKAPGRFILGFAPDPRRPDAIDRLRAAVEIFGAKVCGELKLRMMCDNPDAIRMYRFCGERGLPVLVHLDYEFDAGVRYPRPNWWYGGGIEAFERAVKACPETNFLGHAPGFWAHISGDGQFDKVPYPEGKVVPGGKIIEMLRKNANLSCDISAFSGCNALKRDPEFTRQFLVEFQDRVLFGRDSFDGQHREFLDSLGLPEEICSKIYWRNARKLICV